MRSLCPDRDDNGTEQLLYYDVGLAGARGGGWGEGLGINVLDAYNWLVERYEWNDDIFIFGFSRGAYTARSLAGFITMCGLIKPGGALGANQLYDRYRREDLQDRTIFKLRKDMKDLSPEEGWMIKYSRAVPVKVVGVWDTVGALGIPVGHFSGISTSTLGFFQTGLRRPIKYGFHAVAIDEHRPKFEPTLWTVRGNHGEPRPYPRTIDKVEQRWFVGAHANVGGGYYTDLLAQIPLRWMMKKASGCGLVFRNPLEIDEHEPLGQYGDSFKEFLGGWYSLLNSKLYRPIEGPPKVTPEGIHYTVNETIDASVFDRYRADPSYRPPNLEQWIRDKRVAVADIRSAVRADDPKATVPD
jgi:uncharacterized protein (DUF2235 family)